MTNFVDGTVLTAEQLNAAFLAINTTQPLTDNSTNAATTAFVVAYTSAHGGTGGNGTGGSATYATTASYAANAGVANVALSALSGWTYPVTSVNSQTGNVVISNVANATYANTAGSATTASYAANAGYANSVASISSTQITSALGFTPISNGALSNASVSFAANSGFANSVASVSSTQIISALGYTPASNTTLGNYLPLTGGTMTGTLTANNGFILYDTLTGNSANSHQIVLAALGAATGNYSGQATSIANNVALDPGTVSGTAIGSVFVKVGAVVANATYATTAGAATTASFAANSGTANVALSALSGWSYPVTSVNSQTGNVVISNVPNSAYANTAGSATTASYAANSGFANAVASISSTQITSALGFTPASNTILTNPTITGNATISGNAVVSGTLTMTAINLPQYINIPTGQAYVVSPQGTIAAFTASTNGVNYIAYQSSSVGNPPGIVAVGETTGGLTISSGGGQLQLNCYNTQDLLLGKQNMLANGSAGFPCIPCISGLPTGTPGTNNGTVQAGWQSPIITSNNGGTYALYAWVNYGWHSVQLGGSYVTSAALPATSGLYGGSGSAGQANAITIGSNLTLANGVLSASGGGGSSNPTVYLVNSSNSYTYSGTTSTYIKWLSNAASIKAQTIPTANAALSGVMIVVKDGYGNAGIAGNAITITPVSNTCTIDGQSSLTIATNYGFARLFCDGSTSDWSTF